MKTYAAYYRDKLYPCQDGVLSIVGSLGTPVYLTGGTALSRHYLGHRFSDDLDFFVNSDAAFPDYVSRAREALRRSERYEIDEALTVVAEAFSQFVVVEKESRIRLKLDWVNDVAAHFGGFESGPLFGTIDSIRNIVSNKITALTRMEAKDYADLWAIRKKYGIDWASAFTEAREKDLGIDPVVMATLMREVPIEELDFVRWSEEIDMVSLRRDLVEMSDEMLRG